MCIHSKATSRVNEQAQKLRVLEDALKQNVMLMNTSENARKTLESKLKQSEEHTQKLEAKLVSINDQLTGDIGIIRFNISLH